MCWRWNPNTRQARRVANAPELPRHPRAHVPLELPGLRQRDIKSRLRLWRASLRLLVDPHHLGRLAEPVPVSLSNSDLIEEGPSGTRNFL